MDFLRETEGAPFFSVCPKLGQTGHDATPAPLLFDFNGYTIRVVTLKDQPWFIASDICKALGLGTVARAVADSVSSTHTKREKVKGTRGLPTVLVSEAGQYELILNSRKPNAKQFKEWVTGTVLPAIRKDGGYVKDEEKVVTGELSEASGFYCLNLRQ